MNQVLVEIDNGWVARLIKGRMDGWANGEIDGWIDD